jgi:hypothetical protein
MAGRIVELLPRTRLSWSNLAAGETQELWLGSALAVVDAVSAQMLVRVWDNGIGTGMAAGLEIELCAVVEDPDDPSPLVLGTRVALARLDRLDPAPGLRICELRWPLGARARVRARMTQGTPATTQEATIDVCALVQVAAHEEAACPASPAS